MSAYSTVVPMCPYDPTWPAAFERLRRWLTQALGGLAFAIEHIGSTAVPGLAAAPIVDICVAVLNQYDLGEAKRTLEQLEYRCSSIFTGRNCYVFTAPPDATAHRLYVCLADSVELERHLQLRDFLRENPDWVADYAQIKRRLATAAHARYARAKTEFMQAALHRAIGGQDDH